MVALADILKWNWTAIGTLLLAVVTAVSLVIGYFALRGNQTATGLSAREVEQAQRPVVVPVMEYDIKSAAAVEELGGPHRDEAGFLVIPIQNIGVGPAINGKLEVLGTGASGKDFQDRTVSFLGLGSGQRQDVPVRASWKQGTMTTFGLRLTYADVAGKKWVTVTRYSAPSNTYAHMSIGAKGEVNEDVLLYYGTSSAKNPILPVD